MNNACVVGWGTVGKATALTFGIEKFYSRSEANITLENIAKLKYVFICLPTPVEKGKYFTEDIEKIIRSINEYKDISGRVFIIRSTVYPGFARHLQLSLGIRNIVSNPEFLSEDTWEIDAKQPQMIVVGGDDQKYREMVKGLYQGRFKYIDYFETDNTTAELIKAAMNAFFTTKVVFANSIFDIAQKVGANYGTVKDAIERHPWGSKNHFRIFDKNGRGASGKCLRKDIEALSEYGESTFLKAVKVLNEKYLEESGKI